MIYSVTTDGYSDPGSDIWGRIIAPFQKLSHSISDSVYSSLDMLANAEKYKDENDSLKSEINRLKNELIDYESLKKENEDLRTMLSLTSQNESFTFSPPCTVIARTANDPYQSFTVSGGSENGISPGDPVVTSEGIVGVCYNVSFQSSCVRTLFSPKTAISVYCLQTGATGIIEGGYENSKNGLCKMSYIEKSSEINVGDIIVTSGSENYPSGLLAGTVTEVGTEDSGLSKYALVKPSVSPAGVTDVFVITGFVNEKQPEVSLDDITADETP